MRRTYLIDSENINDVWVELLQVLEDRDEILVFYTDKSAHMGYDRIVCLMEQKRGAVHWIKCFEGQNALDFQLVTELGSCLSQNGSREYIIVSNDTGYDAVVRYWQQKGCSVRRIKGTDCEKGAPEERRQEEKAEKAVSEKKGRNNKSEKAGVAARVHGEEPAAQKSCAEKNCGEEPILQESCAAGNHRKGQEKSESCAAGNRREEQEKSESCAVENHGEKPGKLASAAKKARRKKSPKAVSAENGRGEMREAEACAEDICGEMREVEACAENSCEECPQRKCQRERTKQKAREAAGRPLLRETAEKREKTDEKKHKKRRRKNAGSPLRRIPWFLRRNQSRSKTTKLFQSRSSLETERKTGKTAKQKQKKNRMAAALTGRKSF